MVEKKLEENEKLKKLKENKKNVKQEKVADQVKKPERDDDEEAQYTAAPVYKSPAKIPFSKGMEQYKKCFKKK